MAILSISLSAGFGRSWERALDTDPAQEKNHLKTTSFGRVAIAGSLVCRSGDRSTTMKHGQYLPHSTPTQKSWTTAKCSPKKPILSSNAGLKQYAWIGKLKPLTAYRSHRSKITYLICWRRWPQCFPNIKAATSK